MNKNITKKYFIKGTLKITIINGLLLNTLLIEHLVKRRHKTSLQNDKSTYSLTSEG